MRERSLLTGLTLISFVLHFASAEEVRPPEAEGKPGPSPKPLVIGPEGVVGEAGEGAAEAPGDEDAADTVTPAPASSEKERQVIVVTATRTETPLWETGSSIDVVEVSERGDRKGKALHEMLDEIPGVSFGRQGTPGQQTSLFTRGGESDHTLIFVDGVRVNDENSFFDWGTVGNLGVGRAEVFRGTGSALYGTDAMTGILNIETLKGQGPPRASLTAAGTSEEGFLFETALTGGEGDLDFALGGGQYYYGGPDYPNSDYRNMTGFARMDSRLEDESLLKFAVRYADAERGWYTNNDLGFGPGVGGIWLDPNDRISGHSTISSVSWSKDLSPDDALSVSLGVHDSYRFYNSLAPNDALTPVGWQEYSLHRYSGGVKVVNAFGPDREVVWGLDYSHDGFSKFDTAWGDTRSNKRSDTGLFAQYHDVFNDALAVTASGRYQYDTAFKSAFVGRFAAAYRTGPHEDILLRCSVGGAFRAPSFLELYGPWGANPNLLPEQNIGFDFGAEYAMVDEGISVGATFFRNNFREMIIYDFVLGYQNAEKAMTQGVEVRLKQKSEDLPYFWDVGLTYTHTEDDVGDPLLRRPWFKVDARVGCEFRKKVALEISVHNRNSWRDLDETFTERSVPGYTRLDAAVAWNPLETLQVFFRAENIADEHYEPIYSFPAPGFNWTAGVKTSVEF